MPNANDRMTTLQNNGIDVSKLFVFDLGDCGKVKITIGEDGLPQIVADDIEQEIMDMGDLHADPTFRRFVTAQMFRALAKGGGITEYLREKPYLYQFKMSMNELEDQYRIKVKEQDLERFKIRRTLFGREAIVALCNDYICGFRDYVEHKAKITAVNGSVVKNIGGKFYKEKDIEGAVFYPLECAMDDLSKSKSIKGDIRALSEFMKYVVKYSGLNDRNKCPEWADAFKKAGAYYTCECLVKYHGCVAYNHQYGIYGSPTTQKTKEETLIELDNKMKDKTYDGYKFYGYLKQLVDDNSFNFHKVMREKYRK